MTEAEAEAEVLCYLSTEWQCVPSRRLNDRIVLEAATQQHKVKVKVTLSHSSKPAYTSTTCDTLHQSMAFTQLYDSYFS